MIRIHNNHSTFFYSSLLPPKAMISSLALLLPPASCSPLLPPSRWASLMKTLAGRIIRRNADHGRGFSSGRHQCQLTIIIALALSSLFYHQHFSIRYCLHLHHFVILLVISPSLSWSLRWFIDTYTYPTSVPFDNHDIQEALVDQASAAPRPTFSPRTRASVPPPATLAPRCLLAARCTRRSVAVSSNRSAPPNKSSSVKQASGTGW